MKKQQVNLEKTPVTKNEKAGVTKMTANSENKKAKQASDTAKVNLQKADVKQPVETVTIDIDKVTCGSAKDGVFAFNHNGKLIDNRLFPLIPANEHYSSNHHIDYGNFENYMKHANIFPYALSADNKMPVPELNRLTLSSWADWTKFKLAQSITLGKFDTVGTTKDGKRVEVKVRWTGEEPAPPAPKYLKPESTRINKKPQADLLDGISF